MHTRITDAVATFKMKTALRLRGAAVRHGVHATGAAPRLRGQGRLDLGEGFHCRGTDGPARIEADAGAIVAIGDYGFVNSGVRIHATRGISIGRHCKIGDDCVIADTNCHAVNQERAVRAKHILIGDNVWLGRGVTILPGVSIGDHSVIAAGSIVGGDVPAKQVWRGNPAVRVKDVQCEDDFIRG